jgi:hypothetical protein
LFFAVDKYARTCNIPCLTLHRALFSVNGNGPSNTYFRTLRSIPMTGQVCLFPPASQLFPKPTQAALCCCNSKSILGSLV